MKIKSKKIFWSIISMLISSCVLGCAGGCGTEGTSNENPQSTSDVKQEVVLPDYDAVKAESFGINAWYAPEVTLEAFREYKECGFDYIFLMGHYVGAVGSDRIEKALEYCDQLGLKAFVDVTKQLDILETVAEQYIKHSSFVGFNYDEPVIYKNTLTGSDGLVDIGPAVEKLHAKYPDVEFLVNLNPTTSTNLPWGTPSFTYEEYVEAQMQYINSVYDGADCNNWLSCDDYPLCYNDTIANPYYLKTTWLQNLEYLAVAKRDSEYSLQSNFFIQSMAYGTNSGLRNRQPTYEDIRLQMYTLLAFGYDSASYFCYATPSLGGEFGESQVALIDREGNKTPLYDASKKVNEEIRGLENTYMQFNDNWLGVCAVYGTNNLEKDEFYYNKTMDSMTKSISVDHLSGVGSVMSDEDIIIGHMKDSEGNSGFMIVNYNDTKQQKKVNGQMKFKAFTKAYVYQNGKKTLVDLTDNTLIFSLDIGEGIFVIPHG